MNQTPRQQIYALNKEIDALRLEFSRLAEEPDDRIRTEFHVTVTDSLISLAARAENMEAVNKGLL